MEDLRQNEATGYKDNLPKPAAIAPASKRIARNQRRANRAESKRQDALYQQARVVYESDRY